MVVRLNHVSIISEQSFHLPSNNGSERRRVCNEDNKASCINTDLIAPTIKQAPIKFNGVIQDRSSAAGFSRCHRLNNKINSISVKPLS